MRSAFALLAIAIAGTAVIGCESCKRSSECSGAEKAYEAALASPGAGTCSTVADCKCFNGGISDKQPCGGVTDAKTADKLASIAADYTKAQCRSGINCAAWMCTPACESGKCTVSTSSATPAPAPVPSAPPVAPVAEGGATDSGATTCAARLAEIDRVLASGTTKCKTDKDCVCFRGGVSKKDPCGGIIDGKTNERFEALAKEWSAAGCAAAENVACPAMVCEAVCNSGTCGPRQLIQ